MRFDALTIAQKEEATEIVAILEEAAREQEFGRWKDAIIRNTMPPKTRCGGYNMPVLEWEAIASQMSAKTGVTFSVTQLKNQFSSLRTQTRREGKDDEISWSCALCGAPATNQCIACKTVMYCSPEHQRKHWKASHKNACRALCRNAARAAKEAGGGDAGKGGSESFPAYDGDKQALIKVCEHGSGDVDEVRKLIARGINVDEQDEDQTTALMWAAVHGP